MYRTILQIGPINIRSWGLMLAIAFIVGIIIAEKRAKKYGLLPQQVVNLGLIIIIAGVAGARLLFILEHIKDFTANPYEIFAVWAGGLSYYGGFILAFLCAFFYLKKNKIPVGAMMNVLAPSLAIGFFFGRIGCFLNGCCFGEPTTMPWGVIFPEDAPARWIYSAPIKLHPTQLYSSISGLMSFFILLLLEKKFKFMKRDGLLCFSFFILYGLWRFIIEFFRYHESYIVGWFTEGQALSIAIIIFSVSMMKLKGGKEEK